MGRRANLRTAAKFRSLIEARGVLERQIFDSPNLADAYDTPMPLCRAEACGVPSGRLCHAPLWHYEHIEASSLWKCFYHHPPKAYLPLCTTCARICHLRILTRSAHTVVLVFPALDNGWALLCLSATRLWENVPGVCSVSRLLGISADCRVPAPRHTCPTSYMIAP